VIVIFISENLDSYSQRSRADSRQLQTKFCALPVVKACAATLPGLMPRENRRELFGSGGSVANTYEEAVRTLRDSICCNADRRPRSLLLTSPRL